MGSVPKFLIKSFYYQICVLIILTFWLITFVSCARNNLQPSNIQPVKNFHNIGQQVKLLMEEVHSSNHGFDLDIFVERVLSFGEDGVIPLLETAKNNCWNCWGYIRVGLGNLAQSPEIRNTIFNAIEKNLLQSKDSKYVCFLIDIIDSAHYDASIKDYLPLTPNLVSVFKQLLRHSEYLDSEVQYRALNVLRMYDIEISRETVGKVLLDGLQSKEIKTRYDAVRDLIKEEFLTASEYQNAVSESVYSEDNPTVRKEILKAMISDFSQINKKVLGKLVEIAESNMETGKVSSKVADDYCLDTYPFDDSLMFLEKLTGREFGKVNHKNTIEEKKAVVKQWREWWETNKDILEWRTHYRIFAPTGENNNK